MFSQDEIRWIRRYGVRLDELPNGAAAPRTEAERHFVAVAGGGAVPQNDRERLWVRVQIACRYEESIKKATLCQDAMEMAAGLAAETLQLRKDFRELDAYCAELVSDIRWYDGDPDEAAARARRRLVRNVEYVTHFRDDDNFIGPPTIRFMFGHGWKWHAAEYLGPFPSALDNSEFAHAMRATYPDAAFGARSA